MWNTPYYVYSFGIDNDGNLTSAIAEKEFRTAKPTPSDNSITVAVKQELSDGVLIDVTTTNNDTYFIDCQNKSYVDYYLNQYNGSEGANVLSILQVHTFANQRPVFPQRQPNRFEGKRSHF